MAGMVRMDDGCVCVSVVKSLNPSLQEHVRGDSISAVTTPSSAGQQSQLAHGQVSPDSQLCQSGGGGVKRRRASRASVRAGLNLRVIVPSASSGCLLGTPSFTRTHTHDVGMQNMQPHAWLAEPHSISYTFFWSSSCPCHMETLPPCWIPARHPAIISIRLRPAGRR